MRVRGVLTGFAAVILTGVAGLTGDDRTAEKPRDGSAGWKQDATPETPAINAQVEAFTKAFNAGDAKAIAMLYAPDARAIDCSGEVAEGRDAIEREYAALFKENPGLQISIEVGNVRFLSPDAVIEEGTTRVVPKQAGAPPVVNRYTAVSLKRDGKWQLVDVREQPGAISGRDQIRALEWLVGEWVDESKNEAIRSTFRWSDDKQAILREFTVRSDGKVVMTGTQRIGWDPRTEQIKSWEFDSDGGHGEGLWARLGDEWVIKATAVLEDGRTATATHIISPEDSTRCRWRTTDRTVGGHALPVVEEYVMVRPSSGSNAK
jgi:uncharacterized protein (TIGR02246 family)